MWKGCISTHSRIKLDPYISPHANSNSKWIKHINVRPNYYETDGKKKNIGE
jgi:hypothetical protein